MKGFWNRAKLLLRRVLGFIRVEQFEVFFRGLWVKDYP